LHWMSPLLGPLLHRASIRPATWFWICQWMVRNLTLEGHLTNDGHCRLYLLTSNLPLGTLSRHLT
jgi:hypothetical protein